MALLVLFGGVLIIVVGAVTLAAALAVSNQERARRGAIAPIGEPIAGMLGPGTSASASSGSQGPGIDPSASTARPTPAPASLDPSLSPAQRGAQIAAAVPRFDFRRMTREAPIAQQISSYCLGDDLYDVSYSLSDPTGEFAGEMGMSLALEFEAGQPRRICGVELWLFDKNDFKSPTALLISPGAADVPVLKAKAEARGEYQIIEAGAMLTLMAESLQLQAIIVDVRYAAGYPAQSVFESVTVELAVWQHSGDPIVFDLPQAARAEVEARPEAAVMAAEGDAEAASTPARVGPPVTEEQVRSSYTIDYSRRVYVNQPFLIRVDIPGQHLSSEAAQPVASVLGLPRRPGELNFTHRWYPALQDKAKRYPGIKVELKYREDEWQVPVSRQSALLKEGEPLAFEFLVKPLKADVLLIAVEFTYMGARYQEDRDVEMLVTRDPEGRVKNVTTRRQPGGLVGDVRMLQVELLKVDVGSFLTLNGNELNGLSRLAAAVLILAFLGWAIFGGQVASVPNAVVVAASAVLAALSMVLAPWMVGLWQLRGRR